MDRNSSGIEVDVDNVVNKLVSLYSVIAPSGGSILDTSDMIHAPSSISSNPQNPCIKLDSEVCQMLSKDIEETKNSTNQIEIILKQFFRFAESSGAQGASPSSSSPLKGETKNLAASVKILDTTTKLDWLAHICQENGVTVDNLASVLESSQLVWNLFPAAIYASLDCMLQMSIMWKLIGAYVDLKGLAEGKSDAILPHDNPIVVHAKQEITTLLETRLKIIGSDNKARAPVPVTEILLDIIVPVLRTINERFK